MHTQLEIFITDMKDDSQYDNAIPCENAYWEHPAEDGKTDQRPREMTRRKERVICRLMTQAIYFANAWTDAARKNASHDDQNKEIKGIMRCTIADIYKDILTEHGCEGHWGTYYAWWVVDQISQAMKAPGREQHCKRGMYNTIHLGDWPMRQQMKTWLKQNEQMKERLEQERISDGCQGRTLNIGSDMTKESEQKTDETTKTAMRQEAQAILNEMKKEMNEEEQRLRAPGAPAPTYDSVGEEHEQRGDQIDAQIQHAIEEVKDKIKELIEKTARDKAAAAKAAAVTKPATTTSATTKPVAAGGGDQKRPQPSAPSTSGAVGRADSPAPAAPPGADGTGGNPGSNKPQEGELDCENEDSSGVLSGTETHTGSSVSVSKGRHAMPGQLPCSELKNLLRQQDITSSPPAVIGGGSPEPRPAGTEDAARTPIQNPEHAQPTAAVGRVHSAADEEAKDREAQEEARRAQEKAVQDEIQAIENWETAEKEDAQKIKQWVSDGTKAHSDFGLELTRTSKETNDPGGGIAPPTLHAGTSNHPIEYPGTPGNPNNGPDVPDLTGTVLTATTPVLFFLSAVTVALLGYSLWKLHLEVLHECETAEWENVNDDYLQILVEQFMGGNNGHSSSPASSSNEESTTGHSTSHSRLTRDPTATDSCLPNDDNPWRCMESIQFATDPCAPHAHDHDPWSCMQSIQLDAEQSRAHSNHRQANSAHDWHTHWIPWIDRNKHILRACTTQPWFLQLKADWKQYLREHMVANGASGEHRTAATMETQKLHAWKEWVAQQHRQMRMYGQEASFQHLLNNVEEETESHKGDIPRVEQHLDVEKSTSFHMTIGTGGYSLNAYKMYIYMNNMNGSYSPLCEVNY
ncbi:hypothetical protein AK88_05592 [Plasmodium fragile]|uniref:Schizont-infected cell agglutination C-terminal domain-containing protein n=1 Tax=Plasmodium fragile TaxID=5857 RepID=A0A0D9QGD6_PLAFR|nr:uncharacterized protein AK88_05592 [Plasmodium fragile]KJP84776.1 hypothetical protein AK88_05592 [Plasmodium fragile]